MVQNAAGTKIRKGGRMAELSHDEVIQILGPLSDVIVAEIIATGITKDELAAARERVVQGTEKLIIPGPD
jgi:hypothetical protein